MVKSPTVQPNANENNQNDINSQPKPPSNVWGSHLLKKNIIQPTVEKKEKAALKITESWRDKMRKNIGPDSIKQLEKRKTVNPADDSFPTPDVFCKDSPAVQQPVDVSAFGSQIKILSKTPKNNSFTQNSNSPALSTSKLNFVKNSPFAGQKRSNLITKPVKLDFIVTEDLSDLTNLRNEEKINEAEEVTPSSSFSPQGTHYEQINQPVEPQEPFINEIKDDSNETESFLEANFRQKSKNHELFPSKTLPSVKYEDICLPSTETEAPDTPSATKSLPDAEEPTTSSAVEGKTRKNTVSQGNFVRINMKKKCFSKKGGAGNFLRKQVKTDSILFELGISNNMPIIEEF